ncbi:MAG TPA: hypothetical protein VL135_07875 [Terracidiphilus sp.]|nr:hypothetical protein [Terracidiphilus sp.]
MEVACIHQQAIAKSLQGIKGIIKLLLFLEVTAGAIEEFSGSQHYGIARLGDTLWRFRAINFEKSRPVEFLPLGGPESRG